MREISINVARTMLEEVEKNVKHYKTDFVRDIEVLTQKENDLPVYWLTRECGTNIISFLHWENKSDKKKKEYIEDAIGMVDYYKYEAESNWHKISNVYASETRTDGGDDFSEITEMKPDEVIDELNKIKEQF